MTLTKEELDYVDAQEKTIKSLQDKLQTGQSTQSQQDYYMQNQEKGMIKEQLDLSEEMERIENLLRGRIIKKENGKKFWAEPMDNEMVILSEYGIHLILNVISWYINKNTLLSHYDDETILQKMEDFATDLSDTIFMEYEKIFQYPTFEDCQKILEERIENKIKLKKYAQEVLGKDLDEELIEEDIVAEMEDRIEIEMHKIKEQIIKGKLKRFMIVLRTIQDTVHSTYRRAWNGMERKTLREHVHISEMKGGGSSLPMQQPSRMNPLNWVKR